jgi:hypothetical protein
MRMAAPRGSEAAAARVTAAHLLASRLAQEGRLAAGWTAEDAERTLVILTSFQTFDLPFTGQRLPAAAVRDQVLKLADRLLATP